LSEQVKQQKPDVHTPARKSHNRKPNRKAIGHPKIRPISLCLTCADHRCGIAQRMAANLGEPSLITSSEVGWTGIIYVHLDEMITSNLIFGRILIL
jgi:hypothetical protein